MENVKEFAHDQKEKFKKSSESAMHGIQHLADENKSYWQRLLENTKAFTDNIAGAKSINEAIDLQFEFAKSQTKDFVAQMGKFGEIYKGIAAETYKPAEKAMEQGREAMQR